MFGMCYTVHMEISQEQREKIAELAERYQLRLVLLFGSQATGLTHPQSDVDIGFLAERPIEDYTTRFNMEEEVRHIFNRGDLELVDLSATTPLLQRNASRDGVLLYESEKGNFVRFQVIALRQFIETAPLRRLRHERIQELVKSL